MHEQTSDDDADVDVDVPEEFAALSALLADAPDAPDAPDEQTLANRRRRRRRARIAGIVTASVITALLAAGGGYVAWALHAPLPSPTVSFSAPDTTIALAADLRLPSSGSSAISVAGADVYFGPTASELWMAEGADTVRPIASITKLVTALVILDARPLAGADDPGPTITFDKADHDLYDKYYVLGATIAAMPTGSSLSQYEALEAMLIPSASNYAEAMARWAFGSQRGFADAAAAWLSAHGLTSTTIVEPTGISEQNVSTATDLLALAKIAAADPVIARITSTPSVSLPGPGRLSNTNDLLGRDGITGLKTGNLGPGSYNLLYTATLDVGLPEPLSITGVMLGGGSREGVNGEVLSLLDRIRRGFRQVPVATRGQQLGTVTTPWGATASVVIGADTTVFAWSSTPITAAVSETPSDSYDEGTVVGTVTWTSGPDTATAPVEISGALAPPTDWWRLTHPSELLGGR